MAATKTDCRTKEGKVVGLIDAIITMASLWKEMGGHRDEMIGGDAVREALLDLADDENFDLLMVKMFCVKTAKREEGKLSAGVPPMRTPKSEQVAVIMARNSWVANFAEARHLIIQGAVYINGVKITDTLAKITDGDEFLIKGRGRSIRMIQEYFNKD